MPRLIVKFPYTKGRTRKRAAHLKNYVKYMAMREGAEKLSPPEFQQKKNYTDYIASRPRAERMGSHALFSGTDEPIILSQVAEEIANHPGNVWKPIISLQREDAERLGYDNAQTWKNLLSSYAIEMAQHMKIPIDQFRWYAAFHDEGHHPHVHMVCFSADGKSGFLTKDGLAKIKSGLAKEIFRQELTEIYSRQTQRRNDLTKEAGDTLKNLIQQMQSGTLENEKIGDLLLQLTEKLKITGGKKQYGYLKAPLKVLVDEIVEELAKDPRITEAYDLWYELREDVLRTYKDTMPERIPLPQQKEFKRIKNLVIQEAVQLGESMGHFVLPDEDKEPLLQDISTKDFSENDPADDLDFTEPKVDWSDRYKMAREYLYGDKNAPPDFEKAFALFLTEAEDGNALAMYDLGRMFADGLGRKINMEQAQSWYKKALDAFLEMEPTLYIEYRIGKMYAAGLGTEQDYIQAASWFQEAAEQDNRFAMYSLAGLYLRGQEVEMDAVKARDLYKKSAVKGFPYAAYELAKMYRDGIGGDKSDPTAKEYFSMALLGFRSMEQESHDDKLQYRIGWMLLHGVGTEKDEAAAKGWFEKASRLGNPQAQYQLAKLILADPDGNSKQIEEAMGWLIKSAEAGNDHAQYALAKLLITQGDIEKGIYWLTAAAEQGNQFAQYSLSKHFFSQEDTKQAVRWLTSSAEQGNQFAQYTLGKLFLLGVKDEIEPDQRTAVYWLTRSADQGNEYAQYFLLHLDDFRQRLVAQGVARLLNHLGNIFQEQMPPSPGGLRVKVDHKLRRKIQEKKAAQGHKRDDHEPTMTQ